MSKNIRRREFLKAGTLGILAASVGCDEILKNERSRASDNTKLFRLWASCCSHATLPAGKKESLAKAIRQSEGANGDGAPAFEWDTALHLGDFCWPWPNDDVGKEVVRQFSALKKHRREQFYCVAGNHDASLANEPTQWWFRKWIDPTGENTEYSGVDPTKRPYAIEGTWERYSFRVGNILFLMMCDRNDADPPVGRGSSHGGYPAGAVSGETFEWWKNMVNENSDNIIISAHHHMLKETTVASGPWEGFRKNKNGNWRTEYHGYFPDGGRGGASYLYFVGGKPDAQAFEKYLAAHPGAIDLWLGGHTHTHPDDTLGGRSHIESKWGVTFINVAALTLLHARTRSPKSRLLTFIPGSRNVKVQCYLHTDHYAPRGWYRRVERTIILNKPFSWT